MNELLREISLQSEIHYDRFHDFPTRLYLGYEEVYKLSAGCYSLDSDRYQGMQVYRVRETNHLHVC